MTDGETELDRAHAAMAADPGDDAARLAFYAVLADTPLFLLLAREGGGDSVEPAIFPVEGASYALVFDREDRLAAFAGGPAPYAGLPGRDLAAMLAGQGVGLVLNPDRAPSAMLLPPAAIDWLAETLAGAAAPRPARPLAFGPPAPLPEPLAAALDRRLAAVAGVAEGAILATATQEGGGQGPLLAFIDARPGSEPALAALVREAVVFAGGDLPALDVAFLAADDPALARLAAVGRRLDLPARAAPTAPPPPAAPGSDPARPPRLR